MRNGGGGKTDNELRRIGSSGSKVTEIKTHPALTVIKGHKRGNEIFRERFMHSVGNYGENTVADNFLGVRVEIARNTLTGISGENSNFDPSFGRFGKIISVSKERGKICDSCMDIVKMER